MGLTSEARRDKRMQNNIAPLALSSACEDIISGLEISVALGGTSTLAMATKDHPLHERDPNTAPVQTASANNGTVISRGMTP